MMMIAAPMPSHSKRNGRGGAVLHRPRSNQDITRLHDLATRLRGRSVPGVRMSEKEFEAWGDPDVRAEWVNREVILLSPSNLRHIKLAIWLTTVLDTIVRHRQLGEVYAEPMIRLVQVRQQRSPDVVFVSRARRKLLHETYIDGPPDLVMEIVSPDSVSRDWHDKYVAYEASGVREYWVIDLQSERVEAYSLGRNGKFRAIAETDGRIQSKVIRPLFLRPPWLWQIPLPDPAAVLKELGIRR